MQNTVGKRKCGQTSRQTCKQKYLYQYIATYIHTCRNTGIQPDRSETHIKTGIHTYIQIYRHHTYTQKQHTNRQT